MTERESTTPTVLDATVCRFALIEDDTMLRDILSRALRAHFKPAAFEAFADGRTGLEHCRQHAVDLLLTDLHLPDLDGREIVRQLRDHRPRPRIIVLTGKLDPALPAELAALGVAGFVDKATSLDHMVRAVEQVLAGGMYFFAGISPSVSGPQARNAAPSAATLALTKREREVAERVARGRSSKEIAHELHLSVRTVENYRANVLQKLRLRDTPSLVRWCILNGLA